MDNFDKDIFTLDDVTNIVFFSSGDFGIPTLKALIEDKRYNIKGIVTSNDKVVYNDKRILDIAKENGIPYCIPSNEEELYHFLEPIKDTESEFGNNLYYCVISYKKLSDRILSLVEGRAMNVHASILPFLRGAAPINWAIRLGFKQTGLTAFRLSDKIDCGDIIRWTFVDMDVDETYDSLFLKLSDKCVDFTMGSLNMFRIISITGTGEGHQPNIGVKSDILVAPKITLKYWDGWLSLSMIEISRLFRSTSYGLPCKLYVIDSDKNKPCDVFNAKIWNYEFIPNLGKKAAYLLATGELSHFLHHFLLGKQKTSQGAPYFLTKQLRIFFPEIVKNRLFRICIIHHRFMLIKISPLYIWTECEASP